MVNLLFRILAVVLVIAVMFSFVASAQAADELEATDAKEVASTGSYAQMLGVSCGLLASGIIVFGAALGISRIASGATEAVARQPEAGGRIFTSLVLATSLIEGLAFAGLVVCLLAILWLT